MRFSEPGHVPGSDREFSPPTSLSLWNSVPRSNQLQAEPVLAVPIERIRTLHPVLSSPDADPFFQSALPPLNAVMPTVQDGEVTVFLAVSWTKAQKRMTIWLISRADVMWQASAARRRRSTLRRWTSCARCATSRPSCSPTGAFAVMASMGNR